MVWPCDEERRHERCKASNNNEGGREETSRKAQTEVDGQSTERFETTPAPYKARTEPRSMEEGNHGDRPRTGIRSATVSNGEHVFVLSKSRENSGINKKAYFYERLKLQSWQVLQLVPDPSGT